MRGSIALGCFFFKKQKPTTKQNQTYKPSFPLNNTTTGTKSKVTFFEHYKQQLRCKEEMQKGFIVVCGAMGWGGRCDYPQDPAS